MEIIVKGKQRIRELERENRRLKAELVQSQADLAYVAVMADVDLPSLEDGGDGNE